MIYLKLLLFYLDFLYKVCSGEFSQRCKEFTVTCSGQRPQLCFIQLFSWLPMIYVKKVILFIVSSLCWQYLTETIYTPDEDYIVMHVTRTINVPEYRPLIFLQLSDKILPLSHVGYNFQCSFDSSFEWIDPRYEILWSNFVLNFVSWHSSNHATFVVFSWCVVEPESTGRKRCTFI